MKQLNIGIAGFGQIAKVHAIACYAMQLRSRDIPFWPTVTKVYRRSIEDTAPGLQEVVTSYEGLIHDPSIDIIDICTPNHLHFGQVKGALDQQKAVYCEKPLALNYSQAKELAGLAEKMGVLGQVALMYRFVPAIVSAREYIRAGRLGQIIHFRFGLYHKGYLNEERPLSWRLQREYSGGGAVMDLGIHMADMVRYMLGEISEVRADLYTEVKERFIPGSERKAPVDVDDYAKLDVKLVNGGMGTIECSRVTSSLREGTVIEIYGSQGSIKINSEDPWYPVIYSHQQNLECQGALAADSPFSRYALAIYPQEKVSLGLAVDMHLASLYNLLYNVAHGSVRYEETPTFEEAALSQKVIELALKSQAEKNRWVAWSEL